MTLDEAYEARLRMMEAVSTTMLGAPCYIINDRIVDLMDRYADLRQHDHHRAAGDGIHRIHASSLTSALLERSILLVYRWIGKLFSNVNGGNLLRQARPRQA